MVRGDDPIRRYSLTGKGQQMTGSAEAQELKARVRKFNDLIKDHEDGYYEIDLKGNFVFFNPAILTMSGYTADELHTLNSSKLVAPENLSEAQQLFKDAREKGTTTQYVEINFTKKDGTAVFVKMTAVRIKNFKGVPTGLHGFVRDITKRHFYEAQQKEVQAQLDDINESLEMAVAASNKKAVEAEIANITLSQIFNTSLDGMWILDLEQNIIRVNDTMVSMLGMGREQIKGRKCYDVLAGYCCQNQECVVKQIKRKNNPILADIELQMKGTLTPYSLTATPFYGIQSDLVGVLENFRDIAERKTAEKTLKKANDELKRLATIDGLTDIANRRTLDERLEAEWCRITREKGEMAFILCDVDFFKKYNDTYGHQDGDECLKSIARALDGPVRRPADIVARYGGEEFAVILPNTDLKGAVCVAESIRSAVMDLQIKHRSSDAAPVVTLSLGVACVRPETGQLPAVLLTTADQALYDAKAAGRNRVASKMIVFPA